MQWTRDAQVSALEKKKKKALSNHEEECPDCVNSVATLCTFKQRLQNAPRLVRD